MTENLSKENESDDRGWRWLIGSLSLNLLLFQGFIFMADAGVRPLWTDVHPLLPIGWALLSLLLAGILGWLVADRWRKGSDWHWSGLLLVSLVGFLGLVSSANPYHEWFGSAQLTLNNYPLAGLELKSLAILLGAVAFSLNNDPRSAQNEAIDQQEADSRFVSTGTASLASAAAVLIVAIAIPVISPAQSVLMKTAAQPEGRTVSILPTAGYQLAASYQDLGPTLLEAGAIDLEKFQTLFEGANTPLSSDQVAILTKGSDEAIVIDRSNARFLLNLFWAAGLTNRNPLLLEGQMQEAADGDIGRFASTGGWILGSKSGAELFASQAIIELTGEQQALVEKVAEQLYRPCCNNPTSFPDCNHGMAMLGMLELMAAQGASEAELWEAAKYVNAYWFTTQMTEVAMAFDVAQGINFSEISGEEALGPGLFSASGYRNLHAYLQSEGLLGGDPGGGASCGV